MLPVLFKIKISKTPIFFLQYEEAVNVPPPLFFNLGRLQHPRGFSQDCTLRVPLRKNFAINDLSPVLFNERPTHDNYAMTGMIVEKYLAKKLNEVVLITQILIVAAIPGVGTSRCNIPRTRFSVTFKIKSLFMLLWL